MKILLTRLRRAVPLLAWLAALVAISTAAQAATSVTIDGTLQGPAFDGVGAISGGGGNSRLLYDYPAAQQSQILDYLFKPNYGANIQLLKLEIGGDGNSTDGAEPSHEHVKGQINCNVGYEFWLGEQAVKRNPNIMLVALPWAAPGWLGNGNFWSQDTINYDIDWLKCAKGHGLNINYLGGWNERGHDSNWYINLRSSLNNAGFGSVKIVGDDSGWGMADETGSNAALNNAVQVFGDHYVCGYLSDATSCGSSANARASGKPLWASEFGSQDQDAGVVPFIRTITRGFLDAKISGFMNWPLIAALYDNLPYSTVGVASANQPWSGNYVIGKNTWANAHVAQFAQVGWKFLNNSASAYLGGNRANGSYISLRSNTTGDYSTIYETSGATAAQTVNVKIQGGLNTGTVHVWTSNLASTNSNDYFIRQADVAVNNGSYTLTLQPNYIYSVTTTTGQGKGNATSPARSTMALPYSDNFDGYNVNDMAKYFSTMQGAYEIRNCVGGHQGKCLQQVTPIRPINWQEDSDAFGLLGDPDWSNYTVSVDVNMQQAGTVTLLGRANTQTRPQSRQAAYQLRIDDNGAWSLVKADRGGNKTTLVSGNRGNMGLNVWHNLKLTFSGNQITAKIDDTQLASISDASFLYGQVGLGVVGYQTNQFDNLSITPEPFGVVSAALREVESGRCVDIPNAGNANGVKPALWSCNGGGNQQWVMNAAGELKGLGKCLDVNAQGNAPDGTAVTIWDCNGASNQKWTLTKDGQVISQASGKCLDVTAHATANGAPLEIWTCGGGDNQKFLRSDSAGILKGVESAKCIDVPGGNGANGTAPALWTCNNGGNQEWTLTGKGQISVFGNKCMEPNGAAIRIWDCNNSAGQQWVVGTNGSVMSVSTGLCLDVTGHGTADNAAIGVYTCNGANNQKWARLQSQWNTLTVGP